MSSHIDASVKFHNRLAGRLLRRGKLFTFQYDPEFLADASEPLSLSLPLQSEAFVSDELHGFFSGLISEGWLRRLQSFSQKIDETDELLLLVNNGRDLAGAVTIEPIESASS
ncbi:HipA N-terminal domain-containing protein [Marinobacter sp. C2H3]|uniref:HipA N-terminal domain-containing protein n=1 Tax=Marinobacter sp. C2H3 TaxID=3119003 RepID=UPI00300F0E41